MFLVQPSMQAETSGRRNEQILRQDDNQDDNQDGRKVKKKTLDFLRHKMGLVGVGVLVLVAAVITSAYSVY